MNDDNELRLARVKEDARVKRLIQQTEALMRRVKRMRERAEKALRKQRDS